MDNIGNNFGEMQFNLPKNQSNVIKVIGVGGGGSNAVNHMCNLGAKGVDFVICNTDAQALNSSSVPTKIQLGATLTEGLGAGGDPEIGKQSAVESMDAIEAMFGEKTKMVFITVGMGGGTGTGAAPVIAKIAKEMGLLTVAVVTTPFNFEGKIKKKQAQDGIEAIRDFVDSIIVINNNKLREIYGNLGITSGYSKVDEVLTTAAMGISKVITNHYKQNIDFRDANTVLANSGTAIMGSAKSDGMNRAQEAITKALDSPLLNDNNIRGAKNVLLLMAYGDNEITFDEIGEINDYIHSEAKTDVNIFMGVGYEEGLGDSIEVTIVATGFNKEQQTKISTLENKKVIYNLEDSTNSTDDVAKTPKITTVVEKEVAPKIVHQLIEEEKIEPIVEKPTTLTLFDLDVEKNINYSKEEVKVVNETIDKKEKSVEIKVEKEEKPIANTKKIAKKDKDSTIQGFFGDSFFNVLSEMKNEFPKEVEEDIVLDNKVRDGFTTNQLEAALDTKIEFSNDSEEMFSEDSEAYEDEIENDFIFTQIPTTTTPISEIEVYGAEEIKPIEEEETTFIFDLPLDYKKNNLNSTSQNNDSEEIKRYGLEDYGLDGMEDYEEHESKLINASAEDIHLKKEDEVEFKLEKKEVKNTIVNQVSNEVEGDASPMNSTITELRKHTDTRRNKLKEYNHQFNDKTKQSIDELMNEPAYKRNKIELDDNPVTNNTTRTSVETDEKGTNLRSNNSFLHDNVD